MIEFFLEIFLLVFDEVKKLNDDISQDEDEQPAEGEGD